MDAENWQLQQGGTAITARMDERGRKHDPMRVRFISHGGQILFQAKIPFSYDEISRPMRDSDVTEHPEAWAAFLAARNSTGKAPVQEGK